MKMFSKPSLLATAAAVVACVVIAATPDVIEAKRNNSKDRILKKQKRNNSKDRILKKSGGGSSYGGGSKSYGSKNKSSFGGSSSSKPFKKAAALSGAAIWVGSGNRRRRYYYGSDVRSHYMATLSPVVETTNSGAVVAEESREQSSSSSTTPSNDNVNGTVELFDVRNSGTTLQYNVTGLPVVQGNNGGGCDGVGSVSSSNGTTTAVVPNCTSATSLSGTIAIYQSTSCDFDTLQSSTLLFASTRSGLWNGMVYTADGDGNAEGEKRLGFNVLGSSLGGKVIAMRDSGQKPIACGSLNAIFDADVASSSATTAAFVRMVMILMGASSICSFLVLA